jgi:UDP-glucose:(heptosyl)LPS alpha-1,3-glucosyltransferase
MIAAARREPRTRAWQPGSFDAVKIALLHKRLDLQGGTERDLYQTAAGLRDRGHEVHLFCTEYGVEAPQGVVAHRVRTIPLGRTARLWSAAWSGFRAARRKQCDVVLGFGRSARQDVLRCGGGTHRGFLARMGSERGSRRRFWQTISPYHRSVVAIEQRQFADDGARRIIAVSEQVKRDILANYAVPPAKITVLYNGVDTRRFHPDRRADMRVYVRERWKIPRAAPLVLFVGSGFQRKGLERLIALWRSPQLAGAYLLIVGGDARLEGFRARAAAIAPERIVFAGRQEQVEDFYAAADVVALLSLQEAFGNVVLEGLACGLPVMVSRDVGAAEILRGRLAAGVVDRAAESSALEKSLLFLLERSKDPAWRSEARALAGEHSWDSHFCKLDALIQESAVQRERRAG